MKRYTLLYMLLLLLVCPVAAQQSAEAARVLDNAAQAFEKAGGVKADFTMEAFQRGASMGTASGEIELKGEKFFLNTSDHLSWFNGKTQWTYLPSSDEVTITTPTEAELQTINHYALLNIYKKGFAYQLGDKKTFLGKSIYEVLLSSTNKQSDMTKIVLYIEKGTYQPLYIGVELRDNSRNIIQINRYQSGLKFDDSMFVFDKKKYPNVEVIDIR